MIKIELHDNQRVEVHINGNLQELSSMLAIAIHGDNEFGEIMTHAMMKIIAAQEMEKIENIKKANLN